MPYNALFTERQKFTQWWIWIILLGLEALLAFAFVRQIFMGVPFGTNPMSDVGLILVFVFSVSMNVLFFSFKLETRISAEGVHVRFFPFHRTEKTFLWDELSRVYVRTYKPIREYGGWGMRFGLGNKGNAYNVKGNKGLQLEFRNGKKLLIGTLKDKEVVQVLEDLGKGR